MTEIFNPFSFPVTPPLDREPVPEIAPHLEPRTDTAPSLRTTIDYLKSLQRSDGYWWFTLEANETIGAEFLFLMRYLEDVDEELERGIANRILDVQRPDGTWALYHDGPADLSTTLECYFALKIAGMDPSDHRMIKARDFILSRGGIEKARVFTKMHLAMFGIVPWSACPAMPVEFILLSRWFPITIYSFSSWARATIVPLLMFMSCRKVQKLPDSAQIDELFCNPPERRDYSFTTDKGFFTFETFSIFFDKVLKFYERIPCKPLRNYAFRKCSQWTWEHVSKTEDIYPALAYAALAYKAMGLPNDSREIQKPLGALKMFQQRYASQDLPALPEEIKDDATTRPSDVRALGIDPRIPSTGSGALHAASPRVVEGSRISIHQQCCISPVWDTPWMITALLEAGVPTNDPALLKAGRWLLAKQITECHGDWTATNPTAEPGGWSFEFENDYFPDVDDTVQVLTVLCRLAIPWQEKARSFERGLAWLLSMQNDDGGWGAFDRNQTQVLVNRIPFSDHGACLDPSSPDITARVVEFLALRKFSIGHPAVKRGLDYLCRTQEANGSWWARWGVNYLYGTWCALTALDATGASAGDSRVARAVAWLTSVQRPDGSFGESPESYARGAFVPLDASVPSQTAWGLMGLVAGGAAQTPPAARAAASLLAHRNAHGAWDERHYTGTGFPRHFYIRYHGYRHFFPLLALARYVNAGGTCTRSIAS
jgi:squalene-hopene/tetraprenyl-beta-curcumene cyclase